MKSALSVFGLFVLAIAPVQAGGHCNVQALQAFASPVAVQGYAVQAVAQPVFAAPVYSQSFAVAQPVFSNVCAVQAFASPVVQVQQFRVVQVQQFRGARVRNQRVRSKAVTRIR